ncbi:MAG TPA: D-2-hydroxyacid dehydrogenase [Phycisphaerales bacterium]|nr:D-2-hydroxyacid dehydrogenase [Phycisphaerales bacterium]
MAPAIRAGVRVTTAASIRAPQVAEHALALLLALTRRLRQAWAAQGERRWAAEAIAPAVRDLAGATAGVVAMGTIGQEIAQRLKAFGMHVLATRKDPANPYMFVDEVLAPERMHELLARSDAVIVATPRTPVTEGLITKGLLGQMKPSALLVDVSRGGVVSQGALVTALQKGKIAGAALDAFETEPLPPNSALWGLENVILTPHVASASPRYWQSATEIVCRNLARLREGRPLIDEVTPEWYGASAQR